MKKIINILLILLIIILILLACFKAFNIEEKKQKLIIDVDGPKLECYYGTLEQADVFLQINRATFEEIINGRMTFQRAFMSGAMKTKGDFKILRFLDLLFVFEEA